MSNIIYANTLIEATVPIASGQTASSIFSCVNISGHGTAALRQIGFPTGWQTCDVSFEKYKSLTDVSPRTIYNFDGNDKSTLLIPACAAGQVIPLYAHWFDGVAFFKVICSSSQSVNRLIEVTLQPIYQGST